MEQLTEKNFMLYAARHYDNPSCISEEEFHEDLKRITYIKRLLNRYLKGGELKERLILNHVVILMNIFGPIHGPRLLYLKMKDIMPQLKPFLILLNCWPEHFINIGDNNTIVHSSSIGTDPIIVQRLREVVK